MIAPALAITGFGLAVALCYAIAWLVLGRAVTPRFLTAALYIGAAGGSAAVVAFLATHLLAHRPWTARFAAAFGILSVGTVGVTSLFLGMERAWATHPMAELPVHGMLVVIALQGIAALYNVLSLAGFLLLPLGFPTILLFAWLFSRSDLHGRPTHAEASCKPQPERP